MNLMIDLETLGTIPGSAILTIGACFFDQSIGHQFYKPVSLKSQIRYGFTIDSETINWWSRQNKAAQNASFGRHKNESTIKGSLGALSHFIHYSTDQGKIKFYVWSHGASADVVWLEDAYRKVGLKIPWAFQDVRDTRTIYSAAWGEGFYSKGKREEAVALLQRKIVPHISIDDALVEAQMVIMAKQKLGMK